MSELGRSVDLNADLGEGFPNDEAILDRVTSASLACGGHAGDRESILRSLYAARTRGVSVGAHPGYADRASFGRAERSLSASEVEQLIVAQFHFLESLAAEAGLVLKYIKPHGALYNQAQHAAEIARGVVASVERLGVPLLGQPGTLLERLAAECRIRYLAEGFPDRRYLPDGRLVPRSDPNAILREPGEVEAQAVRLAENGVATLCIHGDDPRAVENADRVRAALLGNGFVLRSFA